MVIYEPKEIPFTEVLEKVLELKTNKGIDNKHTRLLKRIRDYASKDKWFCKEIENAVGYALSPSLPTLLGVDNSIFYKDSNVLSVLLRYGKFKEGGNGNS